MQSVCRGERIIRPRPTEALLSSTVTFARTRLIATTLALSLAGAGLLAGAGALVIASSGQPHALAAPLAAAAANATESPDAEQGAASIAASTTAGWAEGGTVRVRTPSVSMSTDGTFTVDVDTRLEHATEYLEVRLRIRRPSGVLLFQKTEIRHNAAAGVQTISFARSFASFDLREGRYPVEVRVLASGRDQVDVDDRLLLVDGAHPTVPLVPIIRIRYSPSTDPQGRFVNDPAVYTRDRDEVESLVAFAQQLPAGERLSVAIPPVLLDEWRQIVNGYELVGPDGITKVGAGDPTALGYARALADLHHALALGKLELLAVPYAEPDLAGLQRMDSLEDLGTHLSRGRSVYASALETSPTATTLSLGNVMPAAAASILTDRHISSVLIDPTYAKVSGKRPTPGVYKISPDLSAVVMDTEARKLLANGTSGSHGLADRLFTVRSAASGTSTAAPVVTVVDVGTGSLLRVDTLETQLTQLTASGWVRLAPVSSVTRLHASRTVQLATTVRVGAPAPGDYWTLVENARGKAKGLSAALGSKDRLSLSAMRNLLLAESRLWAGPDEKWSLADRGRAHASAAERSADSVFSKVVMSVKDMTLSSTQGGLPVSIQNGSGKRLRVSLRASAERLRITGGPNRVITLGPDDNFVTLPVRLGSSLSDRVLVSLWADGYEVAAVTAMVHASYLDRFAVILIVTLILGGLLAYIRHRTRAVELQAGSGVTAVDDDTSDGSEAR